MILWHRKASAGWLAAHEAELLERAGATMAVVTAPGRVQSVVQVVCRRRSEAVSLQRKFAGRLSPLPRTWSQPAPSHPPIRIGRRLQIVSEPSPPPEVTQLVIPAAGAFGTGEHATTAMTLRLLEEVTRNRAPGWRLLDAGTGTGILALGALRLGADKVCGLDNDPRAIAHARQNARLNHLARARFFVADVLTWKAPERYDVITANLFSELLIAAMPKLRRALAGDGRLIVSGILRDQFEPVARALRKEGFHLERKRRRGKWIAALWAVAPARSWTPRRESSHRKPS